jgi:proteasome lid subunit RPN8/RPN11
VTRREAGQRDLDGLGTVADAVIYPHVFQNADREVGGVLVGRASEGERLPLVTGAIEALRADEQRATLTFTQDAWEHVHRTLDADYPEGEQIVGWYHSHPGFGIFLSGHDLFIHRHFFGGPWQVALVVDPHARTEGVFVWDEGEIGLLFQRSTPEGWAPSEPRAPARIDDDLAPGAVAPPLPPVPALPPLSPPPVPVPAAPQARPPSLLALALAGVLGLLTGFGVERLLIDHDPPVRTVTQSFDIAPTTTAPTTPVPGAGDQARP